MSTSPQFKRARSTASKSARAESLVEATRQIALARGAHAVTLTAVADRAGVHHSAMRRYFDSHHDVLLQLAAQGWEDWAAGVQGRLDGRTDCTPEEIAHAVTSPLIGDRLFCDLLANVPLHLEHDVTIEKVLAYKRHVRDSIDRLLKALTHAGLTRGQAIDLLTAANTMAATLWQISHPPAALAGALEADPTVSVIAYEDFEGTLTRLLAATCHGLMRD
jgi:AcrR family transcriptional regulator